MTRRCLEGFALLLVVVTALVSAPAFAATTGVVVVELVDGSSFRGELVEKVPDRQVTIKTALGEVRRFAWKDVKAVEEVLPNREPQFLHRDASVWRPEPPPPSRNDKRMEVVVRANVSGATLQQRAGETHEPIFGGEMRIIRWRQLCVAPCTVRLDPVYAYRMEAPGRVASSEFRFSEGADQGQVQYSAGSSAAQFGGIAITGLGVIGTGFGLYRMALGHPAVCGSICKNVSLDAGYFITAGGLLAVAGGLYLLFAKGTSSIDVRSWQYEHAVGE